MVVVAGRSLPAPVPATWLRVYEPLEAFPRGERERWAAYVLRAGAGEHADELERLLSWRRLLLTTHAPDPLVLEAHGSDLSALVGELPAMTPLPLVADGPDAVGAMLPHHGGTPQARVVRRDGVPLLCPVPAGERALVQAWQVPVAWLVLARSEDLVDGAEPGRYLVPMSRCRVRAARALKALRNALGEGTLTDEVADTARWIEGFHPRSCVELDSRCVVELVGDDGADDVRMGLEALSEGDGPTVAAAYQRLHRRAELLRGISRSS
jgi:hypothetical protein